MIMAFVSGHPEAMKIGAGRSATDEVEPWERCHQKRARREKKRDAGGA